jgi:tripartite-type tricarboxylate transporter receptor subunit TctC
MKLKWKSIGCAVLTLFAIASGTLSAAERYPNKPGRLIVPFGAGG